MRLWREPEAVEGGREGDETTRCGREEAPAKVGVGGEGGRGGEVGRRGVPSGEGACGCEWEEGAADEVETETVALALRGRECDRTSS